jgi:hypothetical protein
MSENGGGQMMMVGMLGLSGCAGLCLCAVVMYYLYSTGAFGDIGGDVPLNVCGTEKLAGYEYGLRTEDPTTKLMACPAGWEENYCFLDVDGAELGQLQCRRSSTDPSKKKKTCPKNEIWDGKICRPPKAASKKKPCPTSQIWDGKVCRLPNGTPATRSSKCPEKDPTYLYARKQQVPTDISADGYKCATGYTATGCGWSDGPIYGELQCKKKRFTRNQ